MNVLQLFKKIRTFIFDIDGVLTDGTLLVISGEQQIRRMNVKDGLGLQMAIRNGYMVLVISGGYSAPVKERFEKLGITEVHMSITDKKQFVHDYVRNRNIEWTEILYMGDDLPDLTLLQAVGLPCCPADAVMEIKQIAKYISPVKGGEGCVRDVIEKVLKVNDHWHLEPEIVSK
jgi:3-deoxy-D-manno-octulosonate 8-phosphate phosphatase (KDO 8-P phosphatase)